MDRDRRQIKVKKRIREGQMPRAMSNRPPKMGDRKLLLTVVEVDRSGEKGNN